MAIQHQLDDILMDLSSGICGDNAANGEVKPWAIRPAEILHDTIQSCNHVACLPGGHSATVAPKAGWLGIQLLLRQTSAIVLSHLLCMPPPHVGHIIWVGRGEEGIAQCRDKGPCISGGKIFILIGRWL
jgi:hypothetical protein